MSIRAISKAELESWKIHPAKQWLHMPLNGIHRESMKPEDRAWYEEWYRKVSAFRESEEANAQAKIVNEACALFERERKKLQAMCDEKAGPDGVVLPSLRNK